ncbi:hypothetical protein [Duganella vulcania]|uniref:Uncharacterized protein n=1 Tax=Duganella vulcania TaxID=2692166 RepID=A0A845GT61_9BURK|nr:hypothetical protein [Duganella vulcania]MYM96408.1 hypothetical protein [Duganella vulcania]
MTKTWFAVIALVGLTSLAQPNPLALRAGELLTNARAKLHAEGWHADPTAHAATGDYTGLDRQLAHAEYFEVDYCSVGKSFCVLQYTKDKACLRLHTQGEEIRSMRIERWSNDCREKGTNEGENLLPADVRYVTQWRNECEDYEQCKGADGFLLTLKKKYARSAVIMKVLSSNDNPVEIYPTTKK